MYDVHLASFSCACPMDILEICVAGNEATSNEKFGPASLLVPLSMFDRDLYHATLLGRRGGVRVDEFRVARSPCHRRLGWLNSDRFHNRTHRFVHTLRLFDHTVGVFFRTKVPPGFTNIRFVHVRTTLSTRLFLVRSFTNPTSSAASGPFRAHAINP